MTARESKEIERTKVGTQRVPRFWDDISLWLELTRNLAVRDIEMRYKHTLLGLYWAIINPLLTTAIFTFVFGVIFHASSGATPYVVFLVTGLTFWNLFANGVTSATSSVTGSAALLAKVYFPRLVLPTAAVLARLIDFGFSFFVVAIFILIYRTPVHWTAIWIVPILGLQILFTLGIGYLVASVNVLYRDTSQLMSLALMIWMWLTPIAYAFEKIPARLRDVYLLINPLGAMVLAERDLLFTGHLINLPSLWVATAWACFALVLGLIIFKRIEPLFAEVM